MPLILDAHEVPDGVLVEDLRILERFQIAAILEIGGRQFDLARSMSFREHSFERNLGKSPIRTCVANRLPYQRDKRLPIAWPALGDRTCRIDHIPAEFCHVRWREGAH